MKNATDEVAGRWTMVHADLGGRFHLANAQSRWIPYLEAAVGSPAVGLEDSEIDGQQRTNVSFSGGAFTLGGGLSLYLPVSGLDIDANSVRFGVGLLWWP